LFGSKASENIAILKHIDFDHYFALIWKDSIPQKKGRPNDGLFY